MSGGGEGGGGEGGGGEGGGEGVQEQRSSGSLLQTSEAAALAMFVTSVGIGQVQRSPA